jgi:hypothetical protein
MIIRDNDGSVSNSLHKQIDRLRTRWIQAHCEAPNRNGDYLILLPGFRLPKGYNKTICTVLFLAKVHAHGVLTPVSEFWVDLPDLLLSSGKPPKGSYDCTGPYFQEECSPKPYCRCGIWDGVPGFQAWKTVRLFLWRQQKFNPNTETLFTSAMIISQRLLLAV